MKAALNRSLTRTLSLALAALATLTLAGCGSSDEQEVRQWMDQTRAQTRVSVPKLAEPKKFIPYAYAEKESVDPFNPVKLQVALARQQAASSGRFRPNLDRRKEALEAYPLDTMKMVGSLQSKGVRVALVEVDKQVYQVRPGNYLGQNFGMVTRIDDKLVEIKEVVQDAGGEWVERPAKLELQESKK